MVVKPYRFNYCRTKRITQFNLFHPVLVFIFVWGTFNNLYNKFIN